MWYFPENIEIPYNLRKGRVVKLPGNNTRKYRKNLLIFSGAMLWNLIPKNIKPEPDTLLPKVRRKLRRTFRPNLSRNFNSFLVRIPFLWTWFHFRPVFLRTLWTICSLMDGGMSAFSITLFTQKFPTSPSKWLVFCEIFFFCWTNNFWWSSLIILSEIYH